MKKIILYTAFIFLFINAVSKLGAQDTLLKKATRIEKATITGKLTDVKTGEPVAAASIYFPDLRAGAASNSQGVYPISNISRGHYLVEVSHLGFSSIIETIELT